MSKNYYLFISTNLPLNVLRFCKNELNKKKNKRQILISADLENNKMWKIIINVVIGFSFEFSRVQIHVVLDDAVVHIHIHSNKLELN